MQRFSKLVISVRRFTRFRHEKRCILLVYSENLVFAFEVMYGEGICVNIYNAVGETCGTV